MRLVNSSINKLHEMSNHMNIVCMGAGKVLREFVEEFAELHLEEKIIAVADNSIEKIGNNIELQKRRIPIISVNDMQKLDNFYIIITCNDVVGVCEQLNEIDGLKDVFCFAVDFVRSSTNFHNLKNKKYPLNYRITAKPLIPKKIHYCWFGKNAIPEDNLRCMKSWRRFCPEYEFIEWNEDNYDIAKNKYVYEAYKAGKWAFVSDFVRLDVIREHGGIYLDTDVEILKTLDDLLYQPAFAGVDYSNLVSLGLGFGAEKGNNLIKEMCDLYKGVSFLKENGEYDMMPIPKRLKSFFEQKGYNNKGDFQILDGGMTVYPEKVLSGKCYLTGRVLPTKDTFAVHHYNASWVSGNSKSKMKDKLEYFQRNFEEI